MAVAAAVAGDSADAGLGVLSAAKAMDLDFIPIGNEEYDFAVPAEYLDLIAIRAFIQMLKSDEFLRKLEELGGYTAENCGKIIRIE
jgi:putative molybdopterin biosynthesis protein